MPSKKWCDIPSPTVFATHCPKRIATVPFPWHADRAIPSAEKAAADLAQAFGVGVGSVTAILEYPLSGVTLNFPGFDADSCGTPSVGPYASLVPFDSEQEVGISVGLQVTYSIQ